LTLVPGVSEYDVVSALEEGKTINEFSTESIMSCGHAGHTDVCGAPLTVTPDTAIEKILDLFHREKFSILPVVENDKSKRLMGLISRKNIITALAEEGFWPEHEYQKRVKAARNKGWDRFPASPFCQLSVLECPLAGEYHGHFRIGLIAGLDGFEIPF
jgi:predicted transcriptional regulator